MSPNARNARTSTLRLVIICGVLTAFPAMSIDLGLPGFSEVAKSLGVSIEHVSQTLSFFFIGFSVSPLIYGPLSDRVGRRPVLLGACLGYAIASVFATITTSFDALLFWRLLQGTGAGAASVLAITVIRDNQQGAGARRLLSYAAAVRIVGPTTAPSIGNGLLLLGGWRWIYGFMALGGIMMFSMVALWLAESSRAKLATVEARIGCRHGAGGWPARRAPSGKAGEHSPENSPRRSVLQDYRSFLTDRSSLAYAMIVAFTFASHFSYITGSLYVFVNVLHVSITVYALLFAVMALCLMLGSILSGRLSRYDLPGNAVLGGALIVTVLSSLTALTLASTNHLSVVALTLLLSVNTICLGLLTPYAQQGAMENAGEFAGTASALVNALMTGMGACASYVEGVLLGWFRDTPAVVMCGQMAFCSGCATVLYFVFALPGERLKHAARASQS